MDNCRKIIKNNIAQQLYGYEEEKATVRDLFLRVIKENECNSALLIGPQRSGKTQVRPAMFTQTELNFNNSFKFSFQLIESVLMDIKSELSNVLLITLDGLIHTEDKQAVKSIAKQLKMETRNEEKQFDSIAENLYYLISCLKEGEFD